MSIVHISMYQRGEAPKQWKRNEDLEKCLWGSVLDQGRPTCGVAGDQTTTEVAV